MRQCSPRLVFGLALAFAAGAASGYGLCRLTMVAPAPEIRPGALDRTTAGVARAASGAERPERTGRGGRAERGARRTERREAPRETAEDLERTPGGDPRGDDPFAGLSREDLAGAVEQAIASRDGKLFKRAAEALGALEPEEVSRLADLLLTAGDKKVSDLVARQLVRFGGKAGVESVARLARDVSLSLEMRLRFIEALADAGPETREPALSALGDLVASGLPQKLEFHAAHAFGRLLGDGAVEGLAGLLESGAARAEPLLHAIRDFARAEDLPRLTGLLEKLGGREEQEMLLRAIGSAAGPEGGRTLLGYLESAPEGVRREAVVEALADLAKKEELPALIPALTRLLEAETQGRAQWQLARAIASHGPEGVAAVGEILARDPDPRRRGEVLRGLESVHPEEAAALARGFLLDPSPELRGRALKVLASSGDPAAPDALRAALEVETEPGLREAIAVLLKHREGR